MFCGKICYEIIIMSVTILCIITLQLNFDEPLEAQGPFDIILHKLTDQLARTQEGSQEAVKHIDMVRVSS
jgi:hypothetical protein